MSNVRRVGDCVLVKLRHAFPDSEPWPAIIDAFSANSVHVCAVERSNDPLIEDDWWISYGEIVGP